MKTKLVPLALLIPAVVLAQPASPPTSQGSMPPSQAGMPPPNMMSAPPVNPAKAASALSSAKETTSKLKSDSQFTDVGSACSTAATACF